MGTLRSTWKVETGICTREWVCRSFILATPIGKSNTPLLRVHYCIVSFEKVPVCVLESSKSCRPLCSGSPRGVLLYSRLNFWVLASSSGEMFFGELCTGASAASCQCTCGVFLQCCWLPLCGRSCCRFASSWEAVCVPSPRGRELLGWPSCS